jgi:site-specific DNA-methyltransferase (adenine-specific)
VKPYYEGGGVQLWHGDMRDILPTLGEFDACVADPPYQETSLAWDRWPDGWPALVAEHTSSMWCFGSMRMFMERRDEFTEWRLSQDVVWEKDEGTGLATDRFRRVHEHALFFYQGPWEKVHHAVPRERYYGPNNGRRDKGGSKGAHLGEAGTRSYADDGYRLARSVRKHPRVRGGISKTQKPVPLVAELISYAAPVGGVVLDPFAGSGSGLLAARQLGRAGVGIEADEEQCAQAAERLSIPDLFSGEAS